MEDDFNAVFTALFTLFNMKFELYGYHISFWNVVSFALVSGILGWAVWEVLFGDR